MSAGPITRALQKLLGSEPTVAPAVMIGTRAEARKDSGPANPNGSVIANWAFQKMKLEAGRNAAYKDYEQMEAEVPEVCRALDISSEFATQSDDDKPESFRVVCPDQRTQRYLEDKCDQLRLHDLITPAARDVLKYGCCYWELIADSATARSIVGVNPLPPASMRRNEDAFGQLEDPAFTQRDITDIKNVAEFAAWQVVHCRNRKSMDRPYGNSMLEPARRVFKQLQLMEDGVVVGRLYRSHSRFVFFVPVEGLTQDAAENYLDRMKQKLRKKSRYNVATGKVETFDSPMTAEEDFFIGNRKDAPNGDVKTLTGAQVGSLQDIEHFQNKLLASLGCPKELLGFARDSNAKANLAEIAAAWSKSLRRLQQLLASELVGETLRRSMIVDGMDPEAVNWEITMPGISSFNEARALANEALQVETASALLSAGLADKEHCWRHVLKLPADEVERLMKLKLQATSTGAPALNTPRSVQPGVTQE